MARIKGKWVGQVVIDFDYEETEDGSSPFCPIHKADFDAEKAFVTSKNENIKCLLELIIPRQLDLDGFATVTVTQLHADLYRDEPSEWTKEEATC